ncbi:MAG: BamA/TamA family outer membrane protein [Fulvivirga sp.]
MITVLLTACSGARYLDEGQKYYEGAEVKLLSEKRVKGKGAVQPELDAVVTPEPNVKIFGSRPKVWFYNIAGETKKEKGFKHWLKTKLGQPPVYFADVDIARNISLLENRLHNEGFFQAGVDYEVKEGRLENSIVYNAHVSEPYRYDTVRFPPQDETLTRSIMGTADERTLRKGQRYDLDKMKNERLRIEKSLKDQGFFHFGNQLLLFRADSTIGERKIDLQLTVKEDAPHEAREIYRIGDVNVYPDYEFSGSAAVSRRDTTMVGNLHYIHNDDAFRPEIIADHVFLKEGYVYTKEAELVTLNRLIQLEAFKFVNVDFTEMPGNELRADVFLTPFKKKSLRLELQAVSKSNNNIGPNLTASFRNRNFLKGAELFELNLTAGYEVQFGAQIDQPLNSYILGIENILTVPRFITPFGIENKSSRFVPVTKLKLGFTSLQRVDFFSLNSVEVDYGFKWRETLTRRHELYPISIDFIQLGNISPRFDSLLRSNQLFARSYEEQFITGTTYSFYYNSQGKEERLTRKHNFYFNGNIDISGNLLHLAQSSMRSTENTDEEPYQLFGSPYAQFVKTDIDIRHYWRFNRSKKLASRIVAGIGYAYGNSSVLPYTKQFSIGGSSSIRAFRARSVGPGVFESADSLRYIDQTADIKLEANVEYRFEIIGSFKGAVFVDAGNIWTLQEDENRPGSKFGTDDFLTQIALGTGVGLRFDLQFFVLRLDLAFPLKIPTADRWLFSDIAINDREWRRQNLVLNIAIGYPF